MTVKLSARYTGTITFLVEGHIPGGQEWFTTSDPEDVEFDNESTKTFTISYDADPKFNSYRVIFGDADPKVGGTTTKSNSLICGDRKTVQSSQGSSLLGQLLLVATGRETP